MSEPKKPRVPQAIDRGRDGPLQQGLIEFYDSQAKLMLAQYRNIERLLGDTDDWTAPGTHCEILFRDLLRQLLPGRFQAGKGFIYGRLDYGAGSKHCPEIDVLVYENQQFRPVFRMEDFAIVLAEATHGAIQVKRRMDTDQFRKGIQNAMDAKDHFRWLCAGSLRSPSTRFFSAAIFFDEKSPRSDGKASETYRNVITELFADPEDWFLAPDVFGSLQHRIYRRDNAVAGKLKYDGFPAVFDGRNIAVLIVLAMLTEILGTTGCQVPFPNLRVPSGDVDSIELVPPPAPAPTSAGQPPTPDEGGPSA